MAGATGLDTLHVTDACLAELCGFTTRHVRTICADAKVGRNSYAAGPAIRTIFEHMEGGGELGKRLMAARIRKVEADASKAEMEFALARKEIAPVEDMKRAMELRCAMIRARMMALPARTMTMLIGETDERRWREVMVTEVKLALTEAAAEEIDPDMLDNEPEFEPEEPEE